MKWFMIEEGDGAIFETQLDVETQAEAIGEARYYYKRLDPRDKLRIKEIYIGQAEAYEDGGVNYDTMTERVDIPVEGDEFDEMAKTLKALRD